jgi:CubicO group peptidase (beta-lactamase class C family)
MLAPNAQHKYSDLAYQLLGAIVTRASGTPYPRYVEESILRPLGMTATGFAPLPASLPGRCATGYDWRALSDELDPAPAMPPVWAEGGLWSGGVPGYTSTICFDPETQVGAIVLLNGTTASAALAMDLAGIAAAWPVLSRR